MNYAQNTLSPIWSKILILKFKINHFPIRFSAFSCRIQILRITCLKTALMFTLKMEIFDF